ncbi:MAG TPA: hypothetical protein VHT75_14780, partial [Acidimicrobiales bacterium]|nr:hypothetical protein [Acidimicrobiales bacterium]
MIGIRRVRGVRRLGAALGAVTLLATGAMSAGAARAGAAPTFLGHLSSISTVASTVPANGDINPYGLVVVPRSMGKLHRGDTLISNFNNSVNQQGTGTTIVEVSSAGQVSLFSTVTLTAAQRCPGGVGLTTALAVFRSGWVVVGSLPTSDGTSTTAKAGCLIVLDANGNVVKTISGGLINGPWDMTGVDFGPAGDLFVTNVLNGTVAADPDPTMPGGVVHHGTVVCIMLDFTGATPAVTGETVVASGFGERTDPGALVVGPTGVGYSHGILYVADTVANRITAVPGAIGLPGPLFGTGLTVTSGGS